jgi:glycolate oxidase iron-sulfur subunit
VTIEIHRRAFDDHRPPDQSLIDVCIHCGFCLPTCPTYAPLWNEEMDSPRGRIVLMRTGLEEGSDLSAEMAEHFDRCLGCMACVTACPSGVRYDRLIESVRPQVERNVARSPAERLLRRLLFEAFTHPGRLRAAVPLAGLSRRLGVARLARTRALERTPRLRALVSLGGAVPPASPFSRLPERIRARGEVRGRVGLLQGCVQRVFFHGVNAATAYTLSCEGYEVYAPRLPRCCGALQFHTGYEPEALRLAKRTIAAFEGCDHVIVNAAGCGSSMKEYGHLLSDDPEWAERAEAFSARVLDVTELLGEGEPRAPRASLPMRVAYHDACHLAHAQGVRQQPRALLRSVPGLEVIDPPEWEICCGSAGVYNLLQPEAAAELGRRKAENLLTTDAEAIAAANPGCTLQIGVHLRAAGRPLPVYHPVELVARSIKEARDAGRHE